MSTNRSKRVWQRHEDALAALEEAIDVDTKHASVTGGLSGHYVATDPELLELERRRVSLESSQSKAVRVIAMLLALVLVFAMIAAATKGDAADLIKGGPEILTPQELKKMGKSIDNLGGLKKVQKILDQVLGPQTDPFEDPKKRAKSMLMFGPPGCGKTEIAKAAAAHYGYNYLEVTGGAIVGSYLGQSAKAIRSYFQAARANEKCILFFDEVETLLKSRGGGKGDSGTSENDRTVSEFLTEMNKVFDSDAKVIVIGATNLPESLDSAAVRRFHRRVYIPVPGAKGRKLMLEKAFEKEKCDLVPQIDDKNKVLVSTEESLGELVELTYGFSSSNVAECATAIIKKARKVYLNTKTPTERQAAIKAGGIAKLPITVETLRGTGKDCKSTVTSSTLATYRQWANQFGEKVEEEDKPEEGEIRPISAFDLDDQERKMAQAKVRQPAATALALDDMAGLESVKARLLDAMLSTVRRAEEAREGSFRPVKNFLLYGPPGTGKSRLAEALAKTAFQKLKDELGDKHVSFIPISAADVKGGHIGESEGNINRWFRIAEAYQPSVLFIDEMDTLLINRSGQAANDGGVSLSVLGTFLQLTDGPNVDPGRQVIIIGATNYPQNIDSAALRRFVPLHITLPDDEARKELFCKGIFGESCEAMKDKEKRMAGIKALADASEGYSGSDISRIIDVAQDFATRKGQKSSSAPVRRSARTAKKGKAGKKKVKRELPKIELIHLQAAFLMVKPSASPADVANCNAFQPEKPTDGKLDALLAEMNKEDIKAAELEIKKSVPVKKDQEKGWLPDFGKLFLNA